LPGRPSGQASETGASTLLEIAGWRAPPPVRSPGRGRLNPGAVLPVCARRNDGSGAALFAANDPVVLAHARALLVSTPEGATSYLSAEIREPAAVLERAAATLDFGQPIAIMLLGVLYMIPEADQPYGKVASYVGTVAPGSYLAISHPASDVDAEEAAEAARRYDNSLPTTQANRSRAQVIKFFDGLELIEPGVVQLNKWRPGPGDVDPGIEISSWAGLGLKR
jgi:hypothetical protein